MEDNEQPSWSSDEDAGPLQQNVASGVASKSVQEDEPDAAVGAAANDAEWLCEKCSFRNTGLAKTCQGCNPAAAAAEHATEPEIECEICMEGNTHIIIYLFHFGYTTSSRN